jgi:hypothetical protein
MVLLGIVVLTAGTVHADWFDDLWGIGGTYRWLRIESSPPAGITEIEPDDYFESSDFYDVIMDEYILPQDTYLNTQGRESWPPFIGIDINTDTFINQGYIRVEDEEEAIGIWNSYDNYASNIFSGAISNNGTIYVRSEEFAAGMLFSLTGGFALSTITNTGDILAEVFGEYFGEAYGLYIEGLFDDSTIDNQGTIAARVEIGETFGSAEGFAEGVSVLDGDIINSEIINSGNILAEVNLSNIGTSDFIGFASLNSYSFGWASGIYTGSLENSLISNSGNITARVNVDNIYGYIESYAAGICVGNLLDSDITNTGDILAEVNLSELRMSDLNGIASLQIDANGGEAAGIWIYGVSEDAVISNSGSITARVNVDDTESIVEAYANGIYVEDIFEQSEITNTGDILAEINLTDLGAYDGESGYAAAAGIYMYGDFLESSITSGSSIGAVVNVTGSDGKVDADAGGIVFGQDVEDSELINNGEILAEINFTGIDGRAKGQAYGILFGEETDIINNVITNNGDILAEMNFTDINGDAQGRVKGISFGEENTIEDNVITNSGTITARMNIDNVGRVQASHIDGIHFASGVIGTAEGAAVVNNEGTILAQLNVNDTEVPGFINEEMEDVPGSLQAFQVTGIKFHEEDPIEGVTVENSGDIIPMVNISGSLIDASVQGQIAGIKFYDVIASELDVNSSITNTGNILPGVYVSDSEIGKDLSTSLYGLRFENEQYSDLVMVEGIPIINEGTISSLMDVNDSVIGRILTPQIHGMVFEGPVEATEENRVVITNAGEGVISARLNISDTELVGFYDEDEEEDIPGRIQSPHVYGIKFSDEFSQDQYVGIDLTNYGIIDTQINITGTSVEDSVRAAHVCGIKAEQNPNSLKDSTVTNEGDISALMNVTDSEIGGTLSGSVRDMQFDYIIMNTPITNTGNALALMDISESSVGLVEAEVSGISFGGWSTMEDSPVTNEGTISAAMNIEDTQITGYTNEEEEEVEGNLQAQVHGIKIDCSADDSPVTNQGDVSALLDINNSQIGGIINSTHVYGIQFDRYVTNSPLTNEGNISAVMNITDSIIGTRIRSPHVYALQFDQGTGSDVTNEGNITAVMNITSSQIGEDLGLFLLSPLPNGNGQGDIHTPQVYALQFGNAVEGITVTNEGIIAASINLSDFSVAEGPAVIKEARVGGIDIAEANNSNILNSGTVDVAFTSENSSIEADFIVTGISIWESTDAYLENSGLIRVDAADLGPTDDSIGETATAAAVLFSFAGNANFSNTGVLYPSANARALSLYDNSVVTLQDGFGYVFRGYPEDDEYKKPIYIDSSSSLNLNDVDLLVYGDDTTVFDQPYYLIDIQANCINGDNVTGQWGDLAPMFTNPEISVNWLDEEKLGEDSAVVFSFTPPADQTPATSAGMAAIAGINSSQNQFMGLVRGNNIGSSFFGDVFAESQKEREVLLASADPLFAYNVNNQGANYKNGISVLPYYTRVNDSGLGADINSTGLILGFEKDLKPLLLGLDAGYGRNEVDFTSPYSGNGEEQDIYNLGTYGIYQPAGKNWFANFSINYHYITHDYAGWTGPTLDLRETDEYKSNAFIVQAEVGSKIEKENGGIYPSAGLRWTNWKTESHTTEVSDPLWRKSYGSISENYLHLLAGFDAYRVLETKNASTVKIMGGLKIEQALSDNEVSILQTLQGESAVTEQSIGNTSVIGDFAVSYRSGRLKTKMGLVGQFNEDYEAYSIYLQAGIAW